MKKYFEHMPDYMSNNLSHAAKVEMKRAHKHGRLMGMVKQKMQVATLSHSSQNYQQLVLKNGLKLLNSVVD